MKHGSQSADKLSLHSKIQTMVLGLTSDYKLFKLEIRGQGPIGFGKFYLERVLYIGLFGEVTSFWKIVLIPLTLCPPGYPPFCIYDLLPSRCDRSSDRIEGPSKSADDRPDCDGDEKGEDEVEAAQPRPDVDEVQTGEPT